MRILGKATLATVLVATVLTAASPAMAQGYYRDHRGRGDSTGAAIAGGIIGLALGAIIATSVNNRNDRYIDRGWTWRDGYYWDRDGRRYYRDGRPCDERDDRRGFDRRGQDRRGFDDRGYGFGDRGYYGRDGYYGDRSYRHAY